MSSLEYSDSSGLDKTDNKKSGTEFELRDLKYVKIVSVNEIIPISNRIRHSTSTHWLVSITITYNTSFLNQALVDAMHATYPEVSDAYPTQFTAAPELMNDIIQIKKRWSI